MYSLIFFLFILMCFVQLLCLQLPECVVSYFSICFNVFCLVSLFSITWMCSPHHPSFTLQRATRVVVPRVKTALTAASAVTHLHAPVLVTGQDQHVKVSLPIDSTSERYKCILHFILMSSTLSHAFFLINLNQIKSLLVQCQISICF